MFKKLTTVFIHASAWRQTHNAFCLKDRTSLIRDFGAAPRPQRSSLIRRRIREIRQLGANIAAELGRVTALFGSGSFWSLVTKVRFKSFPECRSDMDVRLWPDFVRFQLCVCGKSRIGNLIQGWPTVKGEMFRPKN